MLCCELASVSVEHALQSDTCAYGPSAEEVCPVQETNWLHTYYYTKSMISHSSFIPKTQCMHILTRT